MSRPISSSTTPPAMRNAGSEMPKKRSSDRPVRKKKLRKTKANNAM